MKQEPKWVRVNDERHKTAVRRKGERPGTYQVQAEIYNTFQVESGEKLTVTEAYCEALELAMDWIATLEAKVETLT